MKGDTECLNVALGEMNKSYLKFQRGKPHEMYMVNIYNHLKAKELDFEQCTFCKFGPFISINLISILTQKHTLPKDVKGMWVTA